MLPTTPLHHLLFVHGPDALVMTSGNLSEEPIARDDDEALRNLRHVADAFLVHDREIHTRADDSVTHVVARHEQVIRVGRGFAPVSIPLPFARNGESVLAVGAEQKSAVCITRGDQAFLSQHMGDLNEPAVRALFEEVIGKLDRLLGVESRVVAHDLHPEYASTRWATGAGLRAIAVQHHHAHVAACLAEHGRLDTAIGVAFDGTGCGPAGELWGGEILAFDFTGFRRMGHLRPLALPGGEGSRSPHWSTRPFP
jgi:hydrogenase maturation protein HypF